MKPASIDDIKNELKQLPPKKLLDLTLRLARFKKENKELLSYLLFEADNENGYVESLQLEIDEMIGQIDTGRASQIKKDLRRILRMINRQSKYIGTKVSAIELIIHFCKVVKENEKRLLVSSGIISMFQQQINKAEKLLPSLDEDLQYDYRQKLKALQQNNLVISGKKKWWKLGV